MSGMVTLSIIKLNNNIVNKITYTGAEQQLFFCDDYIKGNYEVAIEKTLHNIENHQLKYSIPKNSLSNLNILVPHSYGLIVIDFTKKIIRSMQNYNLPAYKEMINYYNDFCNNRNEPFMDLSFSNSLLIEDLNTQQRYTLDEFFGSTDPKKILTIIKYVFDNRHLKHPKKEFEESKHLKIFFYDNPIFNNQLKIIPKYFDFQLINYSEKQSALLMNDLIKDGHTFTQEEKNGWINYLAQSLIYDLEDSNPNLENDEIEILALKKAKIIIENTVMFEKIESSKKSRAIKKIS